MPLNQVVHDDWMAKVSVKNTFISLESTSATGVSRRRSVPASAKLCLGESPRGTSSVKMHVVHADSDGSTDAHTEGSTCSDCGTKTPDSLDNYCFDESASYSCIEEMPFQGVWLVPPPPMPFVQVTPIVEPPRARLNTKAAAFQPKTAEDTLKELSKDSAKPYRDQAREVISWAKQTIEGSKDVEGVEIIANESSKGWTMIIRPHKKADEQETDRLATIAKDALLDAASGSRCIYFMGYTAPKSSVFRPQGFEATLGAMESARDACWHVFKKGFCRHGEDCCKQHPVCEVPIDVVIECTQFNASSSFIKEFKQEVADLTMSVMATLEASPYADNVEAVRSESSEAWTIEVTPKEQLPNHKDFLLTVAKSALFNATSGSNSCYIMGYANKPFITTSTGFLTMLGDMQDESRACWDLYSKGMCSRECTCRWEHPECFVPLKIVVKERSSLDGLSAKLESLAC